jgi:aminoglycoside/choline kinase family phosphotransferase
MASTIEPGPSANVARLAAEYLGSSPEEVSIERVTGDASTRTYFRARAADASVVIALYGSAFDETERASARLEKLESSNPSARLTFANDPCAHIEVTRLFLEAGLPVPPVVSVSGIDGVILIEDVGDTRLQDWLREHSEAEAADAYHNALELVVQIQDATEPAIRADSICSHLAFDEAKLRWELGFFFANYFNKYLRVKLDPTTANAVQQDFKAMCSELAARPRVLSHRDYHSRNLMMQSGKMFIIDHQDARMGPAAYDVASLLGDPYTALDPQMANWMVEHFIELKSRSKHSLDDVSAFRVELELMMVQRMLKAVGTYASQAAAGNPLYIPYIEPALDRALAAMSKLNRFDATRKLLEETRGSR